MKMLKKKESWAPVRMLIVKEAKRDEGGKNGRVGKRREGV